MATETKHTILCVDDEQDNLDALERIFRKKYIVLKAASGEEALKILKKTSEKNPEKNQVSLIISDQRMPEMTGVEFLTKSIDINAEAVRILLTGYMDIESVISAVNSGQIYRYVTKPWDPRDLEIAVDRAIERFEIGVELKRKNLELRNALKELQTLDQAKSHFMILINHELKTPLTTLLSYFELLKETALDEEQKSFVQKSLKSADRLKEIIFDVLEFVSAETGQTKVLPKKQSIKQSVEKIAEELKPELKRKKQKIEFALLNHDLKFDEKIVESVLRRLLHNASKFGKEDTPIYVKQSASGKTHDRIVVENEGKPLTKDTITKILKPFALDENIMNHSKGIGMGLSVSQAQLKLHSSGLEFESHGSIVRVGFLLPK